MDILNAGSGGEPGGEIGDIHGLMETLNHWSAVDSDVNHLLLISFTTLGMPCDARVALMAKPSTSSESSELLPWLLRMWIAETG